MELLKIKDGKTLNYQTRFGAGRGKVIEKYKRRNGWWVIIHDKAQNKTVSVRPGQLS
jgi:hypothetical protein